MKKFICFLIFSILIFGSNLNEELLFIEAKLYPKIMMLTQNLSKKSKIKIALVYNKETIEDALKYEKLFPKNNKFILKLTKNIDLSDDVFIFSYIPNSKEIKKLVKNGKVIFTLLPNTVKNVMFGIYIGVRVYPYINPKLLNEAKIRINPIILKVGKIYEK